MKIAVITDSGTGWNEHQAQERGLFYLPLQVKCGEEEFLDGINITVEELYELNVFLAEEVSSLLRPCRR